MQQPKWDQFETALLIDTYWNITAHPENKKERSLLFRKASKRHSKKRKLNTRERTHLRKALLLGLKTLSTSL